MAFRRVPQEMSRCGRGSALDSKFARFQFRMVTKLKQVQPVLAYAAANLEENLSLTALAAQAGLSAFHLHRLFSATAGETPKQFTFRLRLDRAALLLLMSHETVYNVALSCGFQSHEVFCRAFQRRFGMRPGAYRERGFEGSVSLTQAAEHAARVTRVAPCVRLFHSPGEGKPEGNIMAYSIARKELSPQSVLSCGGA